MGKDDKSSRRNERVVDSIESGGSPLFSGDSPLFSIEIIRESSKYKATMKKPSGEKKEVGGSSMEGVCKKMTLEIRRRFQRELKE